MKGKQIMEANKRSKELLECDLTSEELIEKGNELSKKNQEITRLEDEKKSVVSDFKARIDACHSKIGILSQAITTKKESREVECELQYNTPITGVKSLIRLDTHTSEKEMVMTQDEKEDLFINGLGDLGETFMFNNGEDVTIIEREDVKEGKTCWESASDVLEAKELVQEKRKEDKEYRVIRGEWDGVTKFQMQVKKDKK